VAGRNADLTLFSRVCDYRPTQLSSLLYNERRLFEYFCKMHSIMPIELYPIFKHKMNEFSKHKRIISFFKKYRKESRRVLNALEEGPVTSRDIVGMGTLKSGWGHNANLSNIILNRLWISGRVVISHRESATKYYALTENVIPGKILRKEPPDKKDELLEIARVIVRASRLVMSKGGAEQWWEVGGSKKVRRILEELERRGDVTSLGFEGSDEKFYVPIEDLEEWNGHVASKEDYVRFLAPLDPLIWSRRVFKIIYGADYSWEVYKKVADRTYGYYSLPVIYNGDYVGLMDPFFRKTDRVLEIQNFHALSRHLVRDSFLAALNQELNRFRAYLGAERIVVKHAPRWVSTGILT
jgi:uncharacterized protein YcaQ